MRPRSSGNPFFPATHSAKIFPSGVWGRSPQRPGGVWGGREPPQRKFRGGVSVGGSPPSKVIGRKFRRVSAKIRKKDSTTNR